jgi:hypothetical protein
MLVPSAALAQRFIVERDLVYVASNYVHPEHSIRFANA